MTQTEGGSLRQIVEEILALDLDIHIRSKIRVMIGSPPSPITSSIWTNGGVCIESDLTLKQIEEWIQNKKKDQLINQVSTLVLSQD